MSAGYKKIPVIHLFASSNQMLIFERFLKPTRIINISSFFQQLCLQQMYS